MPDTPVAGPHGPYYDPSMEARVSRLEEEMREARAARVRLEAAMLEIKTILTTVLPHFATKADIAGLEVKLADKPGKTYMWGILTALLATYACGLGALATLR